MVLKILGLSICIMIMAGCCATNKLPVVNSTFIVSQGIKQHDTGEFTYEVCFNKFPKSPKELDPEFIYLLHLAKKDIDKALNNGCIGVFLNVPSQVHEHGIFWAYFTKDAWKHYTHSLKSYTQYISFISGVPELNGRKLDYGCLPGEFSKPNAEEIRDIPPKTTTNPTSPAPAQSDAE